MLVMILPGPISHSIRIIECQPEYEANPDGHSIARVEKDRVGCGKHLERDITRGAPAGSKSEAGSGNGPH